MNRYVLDLTEESAKSLYDFLRFYINFSLKGDLDIRIKNLCDNLGDLLNK